ncbi:Dystrophin, isoform B [Pseudolycoriella hygida]|uniref:Dystrophin, isoform B n=1 Tax=Pseudolycoriella hygida TaxID=35572 RepID=A0A9Q0MQX1_9DIPT|nr:Dystrophin, isoform B [Pseudolycoriella hygida]
MSHFDDKAILTRKRGHQRVTRLREHWDETSQGALQRKSTLSTMLGDSQRYESKRVEIEAWLTRMETRSEHMGPVGTTADILEAQQKEQKSFHAELHQYKYHIDLFSQLTQRLIQVYHSDDTSRIKRMTQSVNVRYKNLNNGIINRGKLLHAAVNNLQSFDRNMDQFLAWLSEAESACENAEQEIERKPHIIMVYAQCTASLPNLHFDHGDDPVKTYRFITLDEEFFEQFITVDDDFFEHFITVDEGTVLDLFEQFRTFSNSLGLVRTIYNTDRYTCHKLPQQIIETRKEHCRVSFED